MNSTTLKKRLSWFIPVLILLNGCSTAGLPVKPPSASPSIPAVASTLNSTATLTPLKIEEPTSTAGAVTGGPISSQDQASFVSESYPDNSILAPGQTFTKTWKIKNTGSLPWTTAYELILTAAPQGNTLGSPVQIAFPQLTAPGQTLDLAVPLEAPQKTGTYTVYWSIRNERGETVAVDGANLWAKIQVCQAGQTCSTPAIAGGTSANGVTVTLNRFTHDAQSATVDFCVSVSLHTYTLSPVPTLLVDQKAVPFLSGGSDFSSGPGCLEMQYQVSSSQIEQASQIGLLMDGSLRISPPPGDPDVACQTARAKLMEQYPGLDFRCHFSMAGYFTNLQLPSGLTQEQAEAKIVDTIEGAIYGPWQLTLK